MPRESKICIIGSSNTDMVIKTTKLPAPGETVIGGEFLMNPGGKGANQAVAAARLGGQLTLVAKVGNDVFGKQAIEQFQQEQINTDFIYIDPEHASGIALINVDSTGENCIAVASGANSQLKPSEVEIAIETISNDTLVLLQLEIPLATVEFAIRRCYEKGLKVLLNPAPAQVLAPELLKYVFLITPNETEAELLTGIRVTNIASAEQAARKLQTLGVSNVIVTLGSKGAYLLTDEISNLVGAPAVTATDTTAAGDCFNGALAVAISENQPLEQAVAFACKAASISVTRMGAQASMPNRQEVDVSA